MYPHQAERLSGALERAELDALVATSSENVAYIAGFHRFGGAVERGPAFAVFARAGAALVVPAIEVASVIADAVDVDHVVSFGRVHGLPPDEPNAWSQRLEAILATATSGPADAVAMALDRLGIRQGSIGLDEGRLTREVWDSLTARLSGLKITKAAGHLAAARRVKAPYEIECLGQALRISEEALDAVIQTIDRGMTEREVASLLTTEVIKRGGWPSAPLITIGERTGTPLSRPTDHTLRPGNLVRFDMGCVYKGYCSTVGRMAVLGAPSTRQDALCRAVQAGLEAAIGAIETGGPIGRAFRAAAEALQANGIRNLDADHIGHGIGLSPCEAPMLASGSGTTLEPGEVLAVEASHYEIGSMGASVKDTVLVTTAGARVLNRSHHALVVLD